MSSLDAKYPWPSTVNAANFVTVMPWLRGPERLANFRIWKEQMLYLLEGQGVLGLISGEIPPPEEAINTVSEESSNVEYEKKLWRRTDKLVKGWILGSIGKDALDAVWELETAREVWLKLDEIFDNEEAAEAIVEEAAEAVAEEAAEATVQEAADNQSSETSRDLSRYLPLYRAALRGDWDSAKDFFKDKEAITAAITSDSETALHVAVSTGIANDFVKELVELMPPDALALKDCYGNTALHKAAEVGNKEAAIALVNKNEDLIYILNDDNSLPVTLAALFSHRKTLDHLLYCMESKPNLEHKPFEGELGINLLINVIGSEFLDVALDLVEKYPDLARFQRDGDTPALAILAVQNSAFRSGERFNWWQELIYRCIPLKQSKRKAAPATSIALDIENASCDAQVYKISNSFPIIYGGKYLSSIAQYSFL